MNNKSQLKMFFGGVLFVTLILSSITIVFAETGDRFSPQPVRTYETKEAIKAAYLAGRISNVCPIKIGDALYDPNGDQVILTRKPREIFTKSQNKNMLEGVRAFARIDRYFGGHGHGIPDLEDLPEIPQNMDDPKGPDITPGHPKPVGIDLDKCKDKISICDVPNPPSDLCELMNHLKE